MSLFALPFAAIGTVMVFVTLNTLLSVLVMLGWPTVPASLQTVELKTGSGSSSAVRAAATYSYVFGGDSYTGKRVSLYGADNLGSFQRRAYDELQDHLSRGAPYPVHVNPRAPGESILMPVLRWEVIGFSLVFTVLFGGTGWGILISSFLKAARMRQEAVLVQQYPNEPWKHRVEWSGPRIRSSQRMDAIGQSCLAIFWNVASFPIVLIIPREVAGGRYVALTFLVIPILGVGFVYWAVVSLARAKRFGETSLELDTRPGRPGEPLRGRIYAPKALEEAESATLGLRCERQYQVSSSGRASTRTEVLWKIDATTPVVRGQAATGDAMVAVSLEVPTGLPSSSREPGDEYLWVLSAAAPLRGPDFAAEFEVPVFDR